MTDFFFNIRTLVGGFVGLGALVEGSLVGLGVLGGAEVVGSKPGSVLLILDDGDIEVLNNGGSDAVVLNEDFVGLPVECLVDAGIFCEAEDVGVDDEVEVVSLGIVDGLEDEVV
uniref:Uncharacterized protein n=1 Tax=Clastoptera arizonana TaxID=38151 RepID=A0A1B6D6H3_9HEMI